MVILGAFALNLVSPLSQQASADVLIHRNGSTYEGRVVSEDPQEILFDTFVNGIRTQLPVAHREIRSLERKPLPEGFFDEAPAEPGGLPVPTGSTPSIPGEGDGSGDDARELGANAYVVIPLEGTVGVEITTPGIERALNLAEKDGVRHAVFLVESPGGFVYEADAIMAMLEEYEERFTITTVVGRDGALSAATVFVAAADHLFVHRSARVGAATSYSTNRSSGSVDVDAKFNSAWAARLAAFAGRKQMPELLFRAMAVTEVEVYREAETGEFRQNEGRDGDWIEIDNSGTILTLTANDMVDYGFATIYDGSVEGLGELIGAVDGWEDAGPYAERAVERAASDRERLIDSLADAIDRYNDEIAAINENPPRSQGQAVRMVRRLENRMRSIQSINDRLIEQGALHVTTPPEVLVALRQALNELKQSIFE